jgi:hypothetical protein
MPTIFSGRVTGSPATRTLPAFGRRSPETSFSSVDLPQPDGPTIAANSPSSIAIEQSRSARTPPSSSSP